MSDSKDGRSLAGGAWEISRFNPRHSFPKTEFKMKGVRWERASDSPGGLLLTGKRPFEGRSALHLCFLETHVMWRVSRDRGELLLRKRTQGVGCAVREVLWEAGTPKEDVPLLEESGGSLAALQPVCKPLWLERASDWASQL